MKVSVTNQLQCVRDVVNPYNQFSENPPVLYTWVVMQLPKAYQPSDHEQSVYEMWEQSGAFQPEMESGKEPFSIIMPPPNANGSLHAGHLMFVVEDLMTRYARMCGRSALWLPGTDHAGIETQFVYEGVLAKQGKDRFDLGPDEFYRQVMAFTQESQGTILDQFRSMGFSADWSRLKFTLDQDVIDVVYDTFQRLHQDGYIYRGNRIVNWCPRCQAAFADIELDREEQQNTLYEIDYGPVRIATVRPETIFADVAIAVNPEDERYKDLVGTHATIPVVDREIPIIGDEYVDPEFGTGALKITPGHDPADYAIGLKHQLPEISVIDFDGNLVNVPSDFAGLSVTEGRERIVEALKEAKVLRETTDYTHAVAVHERCNTVIEPLISQQWFLRVQELNQPVIEAIENGDIAFHPERFKKMAVDWLRQERDWCISRQIWWGIRIPVYYKTSHDPDKDSYIIATSEEEARDYYGEGNYQQETDTFDTWFSSGQWPFATLMNTGENDFQTFYPTTVMGTAREILHKWVTRMIMFGLYRIGSVPFEHVYLWGLVTDESGSKLSKSKGNYGDPMEITNQYGTDALRMALTHSNTPGNDSPLGLKQVEAMRNYCNKLWNVARFILSQVDETYTPDDPQPENLADRWFMSRLQERIKAVTGEIEQYRFNEAADSVYHLLWNDFADWYLEASKRQVNTDMLIYGLETMLTLSHPFTPFVTEAIWQQLPWRGDMLITAPWPEFGKEDWEAVSEFMELQTVITGIRGVVAELGIEQPPLYHQQEELLEQNGELITLLAPVSTCQSVSDGRGLPVPGTTVTCWLDVGEDSIQKYRDNLQKSLDETREYIRGLEQQLNNSEFKHNAPKEVVKDTQQRCEDARQRAQTQSEQLTQLGEVE